jgi:hypothetical protein
MITWLTGRRRTDVDAVGDGHSARLARYKQLRQLGLELSHRLIETLPRDAIEESAKKLGILRKKTIIFDSEDELAVLMDYCLHDVRRKGLTAIERFLQTSSPPADSDEMILLLAFRESRYSLFAVESIERGIGVAVRDLLQDQSLFLFDVGLGSTAAVGLALASRIMTPDGIAMTTGAALPIGLPPPGELDQLRRDFAESPPSELSRLLIRASLRRGAGSRIAYEDPDCISSHLQKRSPAAPPESRAGRNDLCICGSGRKYKRCCGRRR